MILILILILIFNFSIIIYKIKLQFLCKQFQTPKFHKIEYFLFYNI